MGTIRRKPQPVKLICGAIGAGRDIVAEAIRGLSADYGDVDLESDWIPFSFTDYYRPEMGADLQRRFFSFNELIDPRELAEVKLRTNEIELAHSVQRGGKLCRLVNLDPGYVAPSKLVLASTKDFSHRIYLGKGIYGEVTLNFHKEGCRFFEWTYPDFKSGAYLPFLLECRRRLLLEIGKLPPVT